MLTRLNQFFNSLAAPFEESIMRSDDRDDVRLGKRIFVIVSLLMIPLATIGAILGIIGDSSGMIVIALSFAVISTINLITMRRTQNFSIHFSIWVVIVMILGLAWGVAFGGFKANFGNYWVAFLPLMMVILVFDQRRTIHWFLVFAGFATLFTVLEPYVNDPDNAPSNVAFNNTYTVLMTAALIDQLLQAREKRSPAAASPRAGKVGAPAAQYPAQTDRRGPQGRRAHHR